MDEKISLAEFEIENGITICDIYQTETKILIVSDKVKSFLVEKEKITDLVFIPVELGDYLNYQWLHFKNT